MLICDDTEKNANSDRLSFKIVNWEKDTRREMGSLCTKWHVLPVKRENNVGFEISGILGVHDVSRRYRRKMKLIFLFEA